MQRHHDYYVFNMMGVTITNESLCYIIDNVSVRLGINAIICYFLALFCMHKEVSTFTHNDTRQFILNTLLNLFECAGL